MKALAITCIAAGLLNVDVLSAAPARAEAIDLAKIKCAEILSTSQDEIVSTLAWLDAYYKNEDDPMIVDPDKFAENARKLQEFCASNPNVRVMNANEQLFR
jgi:acid stress chaperone HdeB